MIATTFMESLFINLPATILALGSAIAAIMAAKRGKYSNEKLEHIDEAKLEPIKEAVENGTETKQVNG